jgi:L-ascorbate metabolism protein UlaG (beta-lactamase superfamily)
MSVYNFNHPRYKNINNYGEPDLIKLIKWNLTRIKPHWPELPSVKPNNIPQFPKYAGADEMIVTYINHSTSLVQFGEENILIDPIWSDYAGPFGKMGVKRSHYPGIKIEDLPNIDVILISHSHYDHLDLPTISELAKKHQPIILVGKGVARYIDYCKKKGRCYELDWWETARLAESSLEFHFVPSYHWSSRFFLDKNTSLWGGFVISSKDDSIYFPGDTGFGDGEIFRMIKEQFSNIRLALLPVGAYRPEWFFSSMHISPKEAVEIFKIIGAKYAVPIHFETFQLSDEEFIDPMLELQHNLTKEKIDHNRFQQLPPGSTFYVPKE